MKKYFFVLFFSLGVLFTSCSTMQFFQMHNEAWNTNENARPRAIKNYGKVMLCGTAVYRSGSKDSIQSEINGLAPLLFWKNGLCPVSDLDDAGYIADIRAHEREYMSQWRTKHSLVLEVRIWTAHHVSDNDEAVPNGDRLPVSAGRVVSWGNTSLLSSQTTERLLSLAIKNAVRQLDEIKSGE